MLTKSRFLFTTLAILSCSTLVIGIRIKTRIVSGNDAHRGQFSHNVELSTRYRDFFFCGGSIITNWHILTAAQCVSDFVSRPGGLLAYFDADEMTLHSEINKIVLHPNYTAHQNDIAILRTIKEIEFTEFVHPIALPASNLQQPFGFKALVAGWGVKWDPAKVDRPRPNFLQYQETIVISPEECHEVTQSLIDHCLRYKLYTLLEIATNFDDKKICTKQDNGICRGDFGNGLIHDGKLIGIASSTYGCGMGHPDIYTNVFSYLKWIQSEIEVKSDDH